MVEFFIETSIDKLIGLIRKKKRLKLSDAAKILKVSQKRIDDWVFMLEDKGMVDLKYPVLGEPEIVLKKSDALIEETRPVQRVEVETRMIPGKPIKKENLPVFKPGTIPETPCKEKHENDECYQSLVDELKSLEKRISIMAEKKEDSDPSKLYMAEKLRFLEKKLNDLTSKEEEKPKLRDTDKMILEKLEQIENRMNDMSKKVNKEDSSKHLKKEVKIEGTNNV